MTFKNVCDTPMIRLKITGVTVEVQYNVQILPFAHFLPIWLLKDDSFCEYLPQIPYPSAWNDNF